LGGAGGQLKKFPNIWNQGTFLELGISLLQPRVQELQLHYAEYKAWGINPSTRPSKMLPRLRTWE